MNNRLQADEEVRYAHFRKLKEALVRLESNPDFQFLILEDYFENKPVQLAREFSTEDTIRRNKRLEITEQFMAISSLQEEFKYIKREGADRE